MTIVDRSSEKSDHESVGFNRSTFTSGDIGMEGSCSSSWAGGPTLPCDSPRLKSPGGCMGPTPGAAVYNSTPSSVDRPKDQGKDIPAFTHHLILRSVFLFCIILLCFCQQPLLQSRKLFQGFIWYGEKSWISFKITLRGFFAVAPVRMKDLCTWL